MGLCANVGESSGRARCLICKKKIKKGQNQIRIFGYRTAGSIHSNPYQCNIKKRLQ